MTMNWWRNSAQTGKKISYLNIKDLLIPLPYEAFCRMDHHYSIRHRS